MYSYKNFLYFILFELEKLFINFFLLKFIFYIFYINLYEGAN